MKTFHFEKQLENKLRLIQFEITGVINTDKDPKIWEAIEALADEYKAKYENFSACKPVLQLARVLYKSIGMEPSRYRPASEALIKRILQDKPLYQINALVDFGNYCSLKHMLPVGLYDLKKINGDIRIRIGRDEETYEGLGKPVVYLHDKLVLADEEGPFGNPSSDSKRTCVDLQTTALLFIYYLPVTMEDTLEKFITHDTLKDIHNFLHPQKVEWKRIPGHE
jgi:DNA/RNA-binding domain of Phe-tRNA-synthetase-like protein